MPWILRWVRLLIFSGYVFNKLEPLGHSSSKVLLLHLDKSKVSSLVKEVAPVYLEKQKRNRFGAIKKLACCFVLFVGITASFTGYNMYNDYDSQTYWDDDSYVSAMGLPIDEYGFLEL